MPHLRFRAVTLDTLQQVSGPLQAELCELTGGKPEFVTMERVESCWIRNGEPETGFPFVELHWFERPQEMQDAAARLIAQRANGLSDRQVLARLKSLARREGMGKPPSPLWAGLVLLAKPTAPAAMA